MKEFTLSLVAGWVIGILFTWLKLPLPAPPPANGPRPGPAQAAASAQARQGPAQVVYQSGPQQRMNGGAIPQQAAYQNAYRGVPVQR